MSPTGMSGKRPRPSTAPIVHLTEPDLPAILWPLNLRSWIISFYTGARTKPSTLSIPCPSLMRHRTAQPPSQWTKMSPRPRPQRRPKLSDKHRARWWAGAVGTSWRRPASRTMEVLPGKAAGPRVSVNCINERWSPKGKRRWSGNKFLLSYRSWAGKFASQSGWDFAADEHGWLES